MAMAQREDQDTLLRAPQVCSHCKSIKKGCDKKLPSCSQCIKLGVVCRYGEEQRRSLDEPAGRALEITERLIGRQTPIPRSVLSNLNPKIRLSLFLLDSLADALPLNASDSKPSSSSSTSPDSVFQTQVDNIIRTSGKSVADVSSQYFAGVHHWLPIISAKRFHQYLLQSPKAPKADFSILVLAMRLITLHPSIDLDAEQDRELLYLATKNLFSQVQAFIPTSLHMIQAGILLSHYEHAHGMLEAAYVSVGTAARMACAIDLHNKKCSEELRGSERWLADEEALATWWGIVICDRVISCHSSMRHRPLATRIIREDDYMPLESDDLDEGGAYPMQPNLRYFVSALALPGVGPFGREAQATYLFDQVRLAVEQNALVGDVMRPLGLDLQRLLSIVMEQIAGRWGVYCGATQMLISALYILHENASRQPNLRPECQATIKVTLDTITRMIIDISYSFNIECNTINIEILSPAVMHIARSAQQHILMADNFQDKKWMQDFDELRKMLTFINQRWVLAGKELHLLNRKVDMSVTHYL